MRRKILFLALMCIAVISASSVSALGSIKHFGPLSVEVPRGWTASQQGTVTVIKHTRKNASVAVAVNSLGEATLDEIAEALYERMNGRDIERDSDGDYTFVFTNTSGAECVAILTDSQEGRYVLISVSGYGSGDLQDDIDKIIDSLDWEE